MTDLKLGRLPKMETMRVTVTLPKPLKESLDLYANEHGKLYEPVDAAALIPHMLEAFIRSDKAFMQRHGRTVRELEGQAQAPRPSGTTVAPPRRDSSL
jgi:hypothetical protein